MITTRAIARDYALGATLVHALKPLDLQVPRGQLVALHGRSGSGKTTMLNLIGGLDRPTSGRVEVDGADLTAMAERDLVELRRSKVGFIFQAFGLIPILSAAENVEVPLRLAGVEVGAEAAPRAQPGDGLDRPGDAVSAEQQSGLPAEVACLGVLAIGQRDDCPGRQVEPGLDDAVIAEGDPQP